MHEEFYRVKLVALHCRFSILFQHST